MTRADVLGELHNLKGCVEKSDAWALRYPTVGCNDLAAQVPARMLKLWYSLLSPFARKVRVFAVEAGLAERLQLVATDVWAPECPVADDNPLGKVPALVTPDGVFAGSWACCEYLDSLNPPGGRLIPVDAERWRTLQLYSFADGVMEAAVAHVTERLRRPAQFVYSGYLQRQAAKIERTLDEIEQAFGTPRDRADIASITLACALSYLDIRLPELEWRRRRAGLAEWHARFSDRESMLSTQPR